MLFKDKALWKIVLKEGYFPVLIALSIFSALGNCFIPVASGNLIDGMTCRRPIIPLLAIMVSTALSTMAAEIGLHVLGARFSHNIEVAIQKYLLLMANRINPESQNSKAQGSYAGKFLRDTMSIAFIVRELIGISTYAFVAFVMALGIATYKDYLLGLIVLLLTPICVCVLRPVSKCFASSNHHLRQTNDQLFMSIYGFLQTLPYLKSLNAVFPLAEKTKDGFQQMRDAAIRLDVLQMSFTYVIRFFVFLGEYGILIVGSFFVYRDILTVGSVISLQLLFSQTLNAMTDIFRFMPMLENVKEAISSVEEMTLSPDIEKDEGKQKLLVFKGSIELKHVFFRYPGQEHWAVKDVSLTLSKGKCLVIAGANGAGKTTLVKLLSCYAMPTKGEIFYDGIPLSQLHRDTLRDQMAILFQDSMLIQGTIRENITLGKDYSQTELDRIVKLCGLEDVLSRKDKGLDTPLENERMLSGGERQRVALARTLIRKPVVAFYDEVTNHLDAEGEALVCDLLPRLKQHCAVVIITHDEKIKQLADELFSLDT